MAGVALLVLSHAAMAQDPPPQSSTTASVATVHGVVRNATTGEPLARALVRIEGDAEAGVLTDSEGRFEIPGVPAGPQAMRVVKPGFRDRPYAAGGLFLDDVVGPAHSVRVAADMPDLEFTIAPTCSIRGQIDLSTGDRAQGIQVTLFRQMVQNGRGSWVMTASTKTSADGLYRFAGLADGAYAVETMPAMESETAVSLLNATERIAGSGYAATFYGGARDLSGATKIDLANGDQAQANFTLPLEPFQPVSIKLTMPRAEAGNTAAAPPSATVMDQAGHALAYPAQFDPGANAFQLMLPDGSYALAARAQRLSRAAGIAAEDAENSLSQNAFTGTVDFSVAGRAVTGLSIPLSRPAPGALQFAVHRTAPALGAAKERVDVLARQTGNGMADGMTLQFAQDLRPGANPTADLPPGSYWLQPVLSGGLCEQSFTAGGANMAHEPLAIGNAGSTPVLELSLRDDCAQLTLALPPALDAARAGEEPSYTAYVVPDFETTVDLAPVTLRPAYNGSFTLQNLAPGAYHVYTFAAPVQLEYRNAAALAALAVAGQAVALAPGSANNLMVEVPGH